MRSIHYLLNNSPPDVFSAYPLSNVNYRVSISHLQLTAVSLVRGAGCFILNTTVPFDKVQRKFAIITNFVFKMLTFI